MTRQSANYNIQRFDVPKTSGELFQNPDHDMALGAIMLYGNVFMPNIDDAEAMQRNDEETVALTLQSYFQAEGTHAYLATEKDQFDIVGVANVLVDSEDDAYLRGIAVSPSQRNHGVGTALMDKITSDMSERGIETITIDAKIEAVPFFESLGFDKVERSPRENDTWHMQVRIA